MTTFADSSALVKLYADECGHEVVRGLAPPLVISQIARVEVPAAIWRKQRLGELDAADAGVLIAAFEADYEGTREAAPRFLALVVSTPLCEEAARLAGVHGLRPYDAVQLATALGARRAAPECATFSAFDAALRRAAAAEGFALA